MYTIRELIEGIKSLLFSDIVSKRDISPNTLPMTINQSPSKNETRIWYVHLLLVVVSAVYCVPLFSNFDCYGRRDWDQFMFRAETPRLALLRDHQLPLWNPYVNGGTVLLAHPHCPVASPWYAIVLALGASLGLRVQVVLFMALGSTGMAALLRSQSVAATGCFVSGIVFMMSSHFALHIAEGHLEWCVLGLMPWLMLCLTLNSLRPLRSTLIGAMLLASVLMFGSVYIVAIFVPFLTVWAALECLRRRSFRLLLGWSGVLVVTSLLSAVKLLPQLEFTSANPRETIPEGFAASGLPTVFLDPRQTLLYQATRDVFVPEQYESLRAISAAQAVPIHNYLQQRGFEWAWHEYGCYSTYLGLILSGCGLLVSWRRQWPLYIAGALMLVVSLGNGSVVDLWSWMQRLPLYESLHVPSRFLAAVVFVLAVAAGHGLSWLVEGTARFRSSLWSLLLRFGVPLAICVELTTIGWTLFDDVFIVRTPESRMALKSSSDDQRPFVMRRISPRNFPVMTSDDYSHFVANIGVPQGYENMSVKRGNIRTKNGPDYRGEVWLDEVSHDDEKGEVTVLDWTMSRVTLDVHVVSESLLFLNQNYSSGWQANISGDSGVRSVNAAVNDDGLVATTVRPGDQTVEFVYFPKSVAWGMGISAITFVVCLIVLMYESRAIRYRTFDVIADVDAREHTPA